MCSTINHKKIFVGGLLLFLIEMSSHNNLFAQYFPLGIFNYDVTGPEHRLSQTNETDLIIDINATYLSEMSFRAQNDLVVFSDTLSLRTVRTQVIYDSLCETTGNYYPIRVPIEDLINRRLDRYISNNQIPSDIHNADIRRFVENVHTVYGSNSGLGAIRVAHQGYTDQSDHWPYIQYACDRIQEFFGDNVRSVAIHNVFHWNDGDTTSLENFFRQVASLDVYQHEYYPFYVSNQTGYPYTRAAYFGNAFQTNIIDQRLLASYDQTRRALIRSGNNHTNLEIILQTHSQFTTDQNTYFRRPTEAEIWLQAFLALSRGYKGVHTYVYRTNPWTGQMAYFDSGLVAATTPPTARTAIGPYNQVAQLYTHLDSLGKKLLPLTVLDAYTWNGTTRHKYIKTIANDTLEGNHRTIEVSLMDDPTNNLDYFMLINRRCNRDNAGVWVNAFPQNIDVTLADSMPTGTYQIRDLYSNEHYLTSDKIFRQIKILAG